MRLITCIILIISINVYTQVDTTKKIIEGEPAIHRAFEVMPELIMGLELLQNQIQYPTEALINQIEGKVYVLALIDTSGHPLDAEIIKGIGYGCNEEALRLVKGSKFTAGIYQGKKTRCQIVIPIKFILPNRE